MLPLLTLAGDGQRHTLGEAVEHLAQAFQLSEDDRAQLLRSGQTRLYNRVAWASTYLRKARLLQAVGPGRFQVTDRGVEVLAGKPVALDVAFLEEKFPEVAEFLSDIPREEQPAVFDMTTSTWGLRDGVERRIRERLEMLISDQETRESSLRLLAFVIENADEELAHAWYLRETQVGLRLMAGRLPACEIVRSTIRLGVLGPIGDDLRRAIGADPDGDEEFKFKIIPGGVLLSLPVEKAAAALNHLKDRINSFVDLAMARVRSPVSLEDHSPEAIVYVAGVVARELPQPQPLTASEDAERRGEAADEDEASASRLPQARGRAPIFEHGQRSIASLMADVEREVIALPDLQRPFVWEDTKVRDLLDSLFRGFPVGTLVLWHTAGEREARPLGSERTGVGATTLVIDGQQRLTSLFAVMRGVDIVGKNGATRKIVIAFRPRDGRFEVADAAIRNDPEYLSNVTELWNGRRPRSQIRRDLVNALRDRGRVVDSAYEDAAENNIERAHAISDYRFPTVDIRRTAAETDAGVTEEDVAEVFVRINNQGSRLGQADFVLTLLSVFHGDLRDRMEERARRMSERGVIGVDTQQLLRAVCGVAFGRARMSAVYRYLRGVDPVTGQADSVGRQLRLTELDDAAKECMEESPWRDFMLCVKRAGFVSPSLVASRNAIVNAYALYIRGRRMGVPKAELEAVIARWVFGTLLTARYSGASETSFEQDLARIGSLGNDGSNFARTLDEALAEILTSDYWTHTLVSALETQKARAPSALAFRAAQVVLGARALFSEQRLRDLFDASAPRTRAASEAHHLFPVAWLQKQGVSERRRVNQVANLADVGWYENSVIGARGPRDYVPGLLQSMGFTDERWGRDCAEHGLPAGWETMEYEEFLSERRRRMAEIVRIAFRQLGGEAGALPLAPPWFLPGAETVWRRIGEAERALRRAVRDAYVARFGDGAAHRIEDALKGQERDSVTRALRSRPAAAEELSIVDYLYLGQLLPLLFAAEVWPGVRERLALGADAKQNLQLALSAIAPVRNEIAHIREVDEDRLLRAFLGCGDVLSLLRAPLAA